MDRAGQGDDDDLRAILGYLRSLPSVKNPVPRNKVWPEVMQQISRACEEMARGLDAPTASAKVRPPPEDRDSARRSR